MSYDEYYNSIQRSIVQRYLAMGSDENPKHAPIIRNLLTEELIKAELTPYLPSGLQISKGEIRKGTESTGDCDLIIYRKPVIYQYGSIAIVSAENAKAIIDIEREGSKFFKEKKMKEIEKYKRFTDKIFCVGLHGHENSKKFREWYEKREKTQIFIFYKKPIKPNREFIIPGEFKRLVYEIQSLT